MTLPHPTYVAIIDDHTMLRHALAQLIDSFEGYKVIHQADNGQEFTSTSKLDLPPEIILLDITMPLMNGYETAAWIADNLPDARIIVLSMMDNQHAIMRMLKAGARGYLLKDYKPPVLKAALDQVRDHGYFINDLVTNRMINNIQSNNPISKEWEPPALNDRELIFLRWVCTDKTYKEIAGVMLVSPRTVEGYRDSLFQKLGINNRAGLVVYAIKNGIASV